MLPLEDNLSRWQPGMEPAVVVALDRVVCLGLTPRATLKTRVFRGFKSSEKPIGLKRPHSRRNPWVPSAPQFYLINGNGQFDTNPSGQNRHS